MMIEENKAIHKNMIFLDQSIHSKQEAIHLLVTQAFQIGLISDQSIFFEAVEQREQEACTAVGYEIAIPHGKSQVVKQPFIGFIQVREPFIWDNNEKVKLIFLIGVPEESSDQVHLRYISQLSRALINDEFRESLIVLNDVDQVYERLTLINQNIKEDAR